VALALSVEVGDGAAIGAAITQLLMQLQVHALRS
jgi:hypothetical protein